MNNILRMAHWLITVTLLVFATSVVGADPQKPSPESLRAYKKWTASYSKFNADVNDQGYQTLVKLQDADLLFLQGLDHTKDPVRRLSGKALARLKTDRSFDLLVMRLSDKDMFVRERTLTALAMFQEKRCVAPIVGILKSDREPQLRRGAAYALRAYAGNDSTVALLDALKDKDFQVASMAAYSLGILQVEEAIEPTYQLVLKAPKPNATAGGALGGLILNRNKKSVDHLIGLMDILIRKHGAQVKEQVRIIDVRILRYALMTIATLGSVPDTAEQWRQWWNQAKPLFNDKMELVKKSGPEKTYKEADFETVPGKLKLTTASDSQSYRPGNPIRLDIALHNTSDSPFKVVLPDAPSGWHATMGWGIKLNRTGENPKSILNIEPLGIYRGSYSGPPEFKTLPPKQTARDSVCLQYWLMHHRIWPLSEGTYELTVSFDSSQFPGIKPEGPQRTGLWVAPAIRFKVAGSSEKDPQKLLALIGKVAKKKWLKTDLTSRRTSRKQEAWWAIHEYGDHRLLPLLEKLVGQGVMKKNLRWGNLRSHQVPPANADKPRR